MTTSSSSTTWAGSSPATMRQKTSSAALVMARPVSPADGRNVAAMRVTLFVTCVVDLFEPDVGVATVRVLRASGCSVSCPTGQTCCGQPAWNSGFHEEAAKVARTTLDALDADGGEAVVVPAGSCATMVKVFWPELFVLAGDHDAARRARALG